jgi:CheY-like chemotaxis protein
MQAQQGSLAVVRNGEFVLAGKILKGEPARLAVACGPSKVATTASPKRVLVIEDNLDSVHTLAFLLREMGHIVEYAINGYVALDVARRFRPDFALLDLGLPGMDGFEVCRQIRHDPNLQWCRVVALTALSQPEYRARAREAGCELYLVKPVGMKVLEHLLG